MAEFVTKKENKRRLYILILCAVFSAAGIALIIVANMKIKEVEEKPENANNIRKLLVEIVKQREDNRALMANYIAYPEKIGWRMVAGGTMDRFSSSPLQGEVLKKYLSEWAVELKKFGITKYKPWDQKPTADEALVLTKVFEELLAKENEYKTKIDDLKAQIEKERAAEKAVVAQSDAENAAVMKDITGGVEANQPATGLIGELIRLSKDLNAQQKAHFDELGPMEVDTLAKQNETTTVKNENVRKKAAYEVTKADFRRRIDTITFTRVEARERRDPDGYILAVDEGRQLAYISLLRKDRVFKGTRFYCYSLEKGGQKLDKGQVEVFEVRENNSSIASIVTTVNPDWPIKAGDRIYNEMFEGDRPAYVAFAGRFTGKLSNEEAASLLRRSGNFYQERIDEKTSYLVVAEGYEEHPNFLVAKEYGVKILREKILYDYLGVTRE